MFTASVNGEQSGLYLLFEHQSTPAPMMPHRLHRYMARIWDRWVTHHPTARELPIILPVVLSHTARCWSGPVSLHGLMGARADVLLAADHRRSSQRLARRWRIGGDAPLRRSPSPAQTAPLPEAQPFQGDLLRASANKRAIETQR
ncbi:MAG: Rpn family recombination-promoting nuclease/putative transposase [Deltaproteobacteria bacterium]|nr:Rpn family recombination-promoting nuclease/putative transposase [Deltaproteobacteria bacterium]